MVKKNVELVATWPKVTEDHVVHVVHVVMMMDPCSATWTSPQRKRHAAATRLPRGSHAAGHAAKQAEPTHRRPPRPPYYSTPPQQQQQQQSNQNNLDMPFSMMRSRYLFYPLPNSMHFGWVIGLGVL